MDQATYGLLSEPCGKVSHHTAHQLDLPREPYAAWKNRGALEVGGVLSLLGWALPHKAPPSGHKRPLATHMRGAVLAFPDQDRSHTCCVRDRPTQLCIDRKAGRHSPQPREWLRPVCPPLFPTCYGAPGWVGAGRVRIASEQQPRPDLIYLLGNSSGDFTVAKEAPRSIKHFR
ncbi:hypothetical protein V6N13_072332 [Hibiscus sabdariffa]